jgi:dTDP-4-dehydrorhamnose reductase
MENVLITGANGFLGQHLIKLLLREGYRVIAVGKGENRLPFKESGQFIYYSFDITQDLLMQDMMQKELPGIIVHAAAITQVDECQLNQEKCEEVNVRATAQLLLTAEAFCKHFIYISTDFVFDGEKGDYREEDNPNPLNWYGFTKVQAESIVETSTIPFAIVRTCLVYGNTLTGTRGNIIAWVKENVANKRHIKVVSDQWRTPTYIEDLVKGILLVIQKKATGVYHISGMDKLTPYLMALQTAAYFNLDASYIAKVDASTFQQPGKRPLKTGFNISKAKNELGFEPIPFEEGLRQMFS